MKQLFFLSVLIQVSLLGCAQPMDWSKTKMWKIYALNKSEAFFYPADTLVNFKSANLNDSTVISYLSSATIWPKGKSGVQWMGVFIASYETADKKVRKVVLSNYGGFLFESASKRHYELPEKLRQSWYDFLNENLAKVFEE